MHLKFGYSVLYTPIYRLTERKKRFHVQNCPCGTVGVKLRYVLGLLARVNVVVEFGRKIFLVYCLLWTTLNMAKTRITERAQACSFTQTLQCNHSRIPNCDEVSKWRHSVGSSSYPCQSRYDVGMGFTHVTWLEVH